MTPKLSILIATVGRRNARFETLVQHLLEQAARKPVEVIAYWNNGELTIGEIRQALLEEATGEYVCFIDDDDWVPKDYCDTILDMLGEDYVGFQVKLTLDGREERPVFHSIRHPIWKQETDGFFRNITHLNPIKRTIALQGDFTAPNAGEDERWANSIAHLVHTETYTSRIMYFYMHDSADSHFGGNVKTTEKFRRPVVNHKQFRYHPSSKEAS